MRVLFLTGMHASTAFPQRGIIIDRLARAVSDQGVEVVPGHLGGSGWRRYAGALQRTKKLIRSTAPDIIHVHFGYSAIGLPPTRLPIITSFYGDDLNGTWGSRGSVTLRSRLACVMSQYAAARSDRCIVVSKGMVDRLWTEGMRRRTIVLRDAIDESLFRPVSRAESRQKLGLPEDSILILFPHDRLNPNKRYGLAERSVELLQTRLPKSALWLVNGVAPDKMPLYYGAADVLVVTSVLEGGPSSAKEALACGIPVVTVPVGDLELATEVSGGVTVVDPTVEALAKGLEGAVGQYLEPRRSLLPEALTLRAAAQRLIAEYRAVIADGSS